MENVAKEHKIELSKSNIEKALNVLGIDPSELNLDNIEKSEKKEEKSSDEIKKADYTAENATDEKKEKEDDKEKEGENSEKKDKGEIGKKDEEDEVEEDKGKSKKEDSDDVEKSLDTEKLKAQEKIVTSLEKSIEANIKTLATLNDGILNSIQKSLERAQELGVGIDEKIEKAFGEVDDKLEKAISNSDDKLEKSFIGTNERNDTLLKAIDQRLEKLEHTPNPRKSITSTSYIKKGTADDNLNEGQKQTLSLSRNRQAISNILLEKSGFESGQINKGYQDAVFQFEASGSLSKGIMDDLSKNDGIHFTS